MIRPAIRGDLPGVLLLYSHLHPNDPVLAETVADAAWTRLLASPGVTVFVLALPDGVLAASCTLAIVPNLTRGARPFGIMENVVTHNDHRQRGHGTAVLRAAMAWAQRAGCYKLSLDTGSTHEATMRFYEAAGFTRGGKTHFEMRWA